MCLHGIGTIIWHRFALYSELFFCFQRQREITQQQIQEIASLIASNAKSHSSKGLLSPLCLLLTSDLRKSSHGSLQYINIFLLVFTPRTVIRTGRKLLDVLTACPALNCILCCLRNQSGLDRVNWKPLSHFFCGWQLALLLFFWIAHFAGMDGAKPAT